MITAILPEKRKKYFFIKIFESIIRTYKCLTFYKVIQRFNTTKYLKELIVGCSLTRGLKNRIGSPKMSELKIYSENITLSSFDNFDL